MTDEELELVMTGKCCLVLIEGGGWEVRPVLSGPIGPKNPTKFRIGDSVVCDFMNGSDGRTVYEGVIVEENTKQTYGDYFVQFKTANGQQRFMWRRESELSLL